jgi:hypothetical protein
MHKLAGLARSVTMTLTVVINLATVAVALGTFAVIYTQSFLTGLLVMLAGLISGIVGYGYSIWRVHRIGLRPSTV